jgi:hypothetical protein
MAYLKAWPLFIVLLVLMLMLQPILSNILPISKLLGALPPPIAPV